MCKRKRLHSTYEELTHGARTDSHDIEAAKSGNNTVIMLDCERQGSDLQIIIGFSDNFESDNAERLGCTLQVLLRQLVSLGAGSVMLTDLDVINENDLVETWKRNARVPRGVETPVHNLIQLQAEEHPEATAICAREGSLTYIELDDLSTRVSSGLIGMGIEKNAVLPLYFEK